MKTTTLISVSHICAAVIFLAAADTGSGRAAAPSTRTSDLTVGRLRFSLTSGAKVHLWVDNVPLVSDSHLYLVKPGWAGILLNTDAMTPVIATAEESGAQIVTADFENAAAFAKYRFELRADNSLVERVTFGTKSDPSISNGEQPKAEVEFAAGYVNANALAGHAFTAETVSGTASGIVPLTAKSADEEASRVVPGLFRKIVIDSPLGPVTVTAKGPNPVTSALNLFDARKQTDSWATAHPTFWLGIGAPSLPMPPGDNTITLAWSFGPAPAHSIAAPLTVSESAITSMSPSRIALAPELPIIPKPKSMQAGGSPLRLSARTRIVTTEPSLPEESAAAREIAAELSEFHGLNVAIVPGGTWKPGDIQLSRTGRLDAGTNRSVLTVPDKAEGYSLRIDSRGAVLSGHDARGVYDAAQTFKQLIRGDDHGIYVKAVDITDWPTLSFRGVQWYGGPESFPFHQRMIDRIIAPLKYNAMVLQAEYTAWDSQPNLRGPRTTPKSETRKTIAEARAHFLEPIPLVPSLGHMEWLFQNHQNLDLAADRSHPYTIDPDDSRVYGILFPLYDEIIDLFHPRYFHIGHDEIAMTGVFPPPDSKKTTTELYLESVNHLYGWLAQRGIKTILWGDELIAPGQGTAANAASPADAAVRRAGIPKDVLVGDWHYSGKTYPSIGLLEKSGLQTLASTWYDPESNHLFAREAAKQHANGLLQTTWAGYAMTLGQVKSDDFRQFVAYLIAAEQSWNGGANDIASLGYDPGEAFLAFYDRKPYDSSLHSRFRADLSKASNISAKGSSGDERTAVQLTGALNPAGAWPNSLTIALTGRKASLLEWTWATSVAASWGVQVATVSITYVDGHKETVPVLYGRQIVASSDTRSATEARRAEGGASVALHTFAWSNPHPESAIDHVTLTSAGTEAAPVLAGLSGVE